MQLVDSSFDGCGDDCSVLTEPNVLAALDDFEEAAASMFGRHAEAAAIGITGRMELRGIDGPIVLLGLVGRFWHKRPPCCTTPRPSCARASRRLPRWTC